MLAVLPTFFGCHPPSAPVDEASARVGLSTPWITWEEYPYRALHAQVIAAAAKAGFHTVDLFPGRLKYARVEPWRLMTDSDHPNALGHAWIGEALCARILEDRAQLLGSRD